MAFRIGLYGGAFDPFHLAHRSVASSMMQAGVIDELWVIPTHTPPHRPQTRFAFRHRLRMAELALLDMDAVRVLSIESHLPKPSYSIRTIEHLRSGREGDRFFLCMGEDSLASFTSWHRHLSILEQVTLLVAERPGFDPSGVPETVMERTVFIEHEPTGLSSTQVRRMLDEGADPAGYCPEPVAAYLRRLENNE